MQQQFRRTINMAAAALVGAALVSVIFLAARAWAQDAPAATDAPASVMQLSDTTVTFADSVDAINAPETSIQYQGVLLRPDGTAQPSGTYTMFFRLYQGSGTVVYQLQLPVVVVEGFFSVAIGPMDPNIFSNQLWLGVTVNNDPEMTPRQPLRYVPYAMHARVADITTMFRSYGVVNADGTKQAGFQFTSSIINNFDGGPAFSIDVGEDYNLNDYVSNVTPIYTNANSCDRAVTVSTTSSNGRLIVVMFDSNGSRKLCKFSFSTIDLP